EADPGEPTSRPRTPLQQRAQCQLARGPNCKVGGGDHGRDDLSALESLHTWSGYRSSSKPGGCSTGEFVLDPFFLKELLHLKVLEFGPVVAPYLLHL
ncbi:hypothetical protein ACJX0J_010339, partial [Zea mays]